jgi:hypothetical protein
MPIRRRRRHENTRRPLVPTRHGRGSDIAAVPACAVGPNYHRPDAPVPTAYKELPPEVSVWTPSSPRDSADRGAWWSIFNDPVLDGLERQVDISNQTIKEYEAEYRQAVGLLKEAKSQYFPTIGITGGVTRGGGGGGTTSTSSTVGSGPGGRATTEFRLESNVSWTPDIWGTIRRQVESRKANVQVSQADLANARLSAQATLAVDYFDLRAADSLRPCSRGRWRRIRKLSRLPKTNSRAASPATATSPWHRRNCRRRRRNWLRSISSEGRMSMPSPCSPGISRRS